MIHAFLRLFARLPPAAESFPSYRTSELEAAAAALRRGGEEPALLRLMADLEGELERRRDEVQAIERWEEKRS